MSKELVELADIIPRNHRVACITTNSLRTILDLFKIDDKEFPYGITKLEARSSTTEKTKPIHEDKNYGIKIDRSEKIQYFSLNYLLKFNDDGSTKNPIDELGKQTILRSLDRAGCEDASINLSKVIVLDPKLGEYSGVKEELFHIELQSDPCDSDIDRTKVKEHSVNEALIKYSNFQYRILNCRYVIDRRQELTQPRSRHKPIIFWRGETVMSLQSPIKVAQRIKKHFGEYGLLKQYGVTEDYKLVLMSVSR